MSEVSSIRVASRVGLPLGLFFLIKYCAVIYAFSVPLLFFLYLVATVILTPLLLHSILRSYRERFFLGRPFIVWHAYAFGVSVLLFASIIALPAHYYCYAYVMPTELPHMLSEVEHTLQAQHLLTPDLKEMLSATKDSIGAVSVVDRLVNDVFLNIFWGGLVCLVSALFLRRK